uniref:Uncharacterized protein n=1 Tax=Cucumis melo TaxID=3656 RepID=A0A9I9CV14_CUCME
MRLTKNGRTIARETSLVLNENANFSSLQRHWRTIDGQDAMKTRISDDGYMRQRQLIERDSSVRQRDKDKERLTSRIERDEDKDKGTLNVVIYASKIAIQSPKKSVMSLGVDKSFPILPSWCR